MKNVFDDISVNEIPEGKENEYLSEEESLEIKRKLKAFLKFYIVFFAYLIVFIVVIVLKWFIEFPDWLKVLMYIIASSEIITIVIGAVKYSHLLKYLKGISEK